MAHPASHEDGAFVASPEYEASQKYRPCPRVTALEAGTEPSVTFTRPPLATGTMNQLFQDESPNGPQNGGDHKPRTV